MKHTNYTGSVRCPQCGRGMYQLNATDRQITYGCTMGHIHKVIRPADQQPTNRYSQPPNDAA